ncbi:hypothetical protein LCGC14_2727530 [marine sediment metagenome]|uniref:Uncharacterized protein n=1 Tax=marine sediment metagenome TaxID=412755 RepID=A0A0F9BHA0_9ZZZZ
MNKKEQIKKLEKRIAQLEKRITALEAYPAQYWYPETPRKLIDWWWQPTDYGMISDTNTSEWVDANGNKWRIIGVYN